MARSERRKRERADGARDTVLARARPVGDGRQELPGHLVRCVTEGCGTVLLDGATKSNRCSDCERRRKRERHGTSRTS